MRRMARLRSSIYTRFTAYAALFIALVCAVAVTAIIGLRAASMNTEALAGPWSGGAMVLGEINYNLAALRVAEMTQAMAGTAQARDLAQISADSERQAINELAADYAARLGRQMPQEFRAFIVAWDDYQAAHAAWLQAGASLLAARMDGPGGVLDDKYQATNASIERVIAIHHEEGEARARSVANIARLSSLVMGAMVLLSLLISILILIRSRKDILRPLAAITTTMAALAAGSHDTEVPGRERHDEIGDMAASCEVFRLNVLALDQAHEAARLAEEQAQLLARHDALTGLPNRRVFTANLELALERARKKLGLYSVLLIDLDEFKKINDLQGHQVGDAVLCEIARRLEANLRKTDTAARLGGDEFAVITEGEMDPQEHLEHAKRLAARLIGVIREPIEAGEFRIEMGASIGIASAQVEASDVTSILRAADIAMYRAKQSGRCTFRFFEQSMDDEMRARGALERDVVKALSTGAIKPYFQPLVDISTQRIRGFEALARWNHADRGFVPPDEFIPIVEQLGLMSELSSTILRQSCRAAQSWPADICVSVNFSPTEMKDQSLPARIARILGEEGLAPCRLEVEITETALVSDLEGTKTVLTALQKQGVTICLDDFGTGYSSLYHLRELKFDKVKIDRSFVQAMLNSPDSEKIIDAILGLTSSLRLPAVAEGIESKGALQLLADKGCEYGQGYYFSKPVPAEAVPPMLAMPAAQRVIAPAG